MIHDPFHVSDNIKEKTSLVKETKKGAVFAPFYLFQNEKFIAKN